MKHFLLKCTEIIYKCQRVLEIINTDMAKGGINGTFSYFKGPKFISRKMKIVLEYPSKCLFFFVSIAASLALILFFHTSLFLFSFPGGRTPPSSGYYWIWAQAWDRALRAWHIGNYSWNPKRASASVMCLQVSVLIPSMWVISGMLLGLNSEW